MRPLNKKIGEKLKKVRTQKGMSQGDIAKKLGVHRSYISGIERGIRNIIVKIWKDWRMSSEYMYPNISILNFYESFKSNLFILV